MIHLTCLTQMIATVACGLVVVYALPLFGVVAKKVIRKRISNKSQVAKKEME